MRIILLIMITCFAISCNSPKNEDTTSEAVVKIGSESITKDDIMNELDKLPLRQRALYSSSPQKLTEFLQSQINQKVLYQEASKRGIPERDDIVEQVKSYENKLVAKTLGKEILEELEVSNEDIKSYFDQNKQNYERIDISMIEIKYSPDDDSSKEDALKKAQDIARRANSGESFEALAREYSQDPVTRNREGKVGSISRGRFSEQIDNVVFGLGKDDITKPFEVDGAYLIIKANENVEMPSYDQLENHIRSELVNKRLFEYIDSLREQWGVQIYEDRLEEIYNSETSNK